MTRTQLLQLVRVTTSRFSRVYFHILDAAGTTVATVRSKARIIMVSILCYHIYPLLALVSIICNLLLILILIYILLVKSLTRQMLGRCSEEAAP